MNEKEQELDDLYEERYDLLSVMDMLDNPYDSDVPGKLEDVNSRIVEIELSM